MRLLESPVVDSPAPPRQAMIPVVNNRERCILVSNQPWPTTRLLARTLCALGLLVGISTSVSVPAAAQPTESPANEAGAAVPVEDGAAAEPRTPPVTVAAYTRDDALRPPDSVVYFRLDDGTGSQLSRLRRDPARARSSRLDENLFTLIGRPRDQPAVPGDLFLAPLRQGDGAIRSAVLVESSTGYVAYFPQLGKGSTLGEIRTTLGRPFVSIANDDRNFALLVRRAGNGRSTEAILYHATTGSALTLPDLTEFPAQPTMTPVRGLPTLGGPVSALSVDGPGGRTIGYLILDEESGEIHYAAVDPDGRVTGEQLRTDGLYAVFPTQAEHAAAPRFLTAPVTDEDGAVRHVLVVDAGTGQVAWLANVDGADNSPRLRSLTLNLKRYLDTRQPNAVRSLTLLPRRAGDGATRGVWLLDARSRRMLLIDGLDSPSELRVSPVEIER